ncbi:hypothetical protein SE18_09940 [Herpetosiphon geysericola]|uniref:Uncharacterized protein n=2 Tax=Herpetosiphon geysericola TaxID=70996 RepID=A0A0P6YHL4_9CHLR|nr:hypothetical protein SE18_09940 [Herpetosiphon geysericola]
MQSDHSTANSLPLALRLISWRSYLTAAMLIYTTIIEHSSADFGTQLFIWLVFGAIAWLFGWVGKHLIRRKAEARRTAVLFESLRIVTYGLSFFVGWTIFGLVDCGLAIISLWYLTRHEIIALCNH